MLGGTESVRDRRHRKYRRIFTYKLQKVAFDSAQKRPFSSVIIRFDKCNLIFVSFLSGMIDIAIATVADLYEDNGGIPSTLQFPTLDDVKADVNKVSAGGLRPGQAVIINSSTLNQAAALPGFAVPDMKKTFGLTGVVKNVDKVKYF